ncbi:hypothetical protein H0G77_11035, partial [[Pasteurella] aerogenes]|nr:hypothetical protein [[Pasteurella] aerogenes]
QTVTFTKDPDTGKWVDGNPNDGVSINPDTGIVTIPQDAVEDGSTVTAVGTNDADNSAEGKGDAGTDSKNAAVDPSTDPNTGASNGVVTTTPTDEGSSLVTTVKLTNNNGVDNLTVATSGTTTADDFGT